MTASPAATPPSHHLTAAQVLSIFWRSRWLVLVCTLLATAAGILYVQHRGTIWRATARLYVEKNGPAPLGPDSLFVGGSAKNYANTQAELLLSSPVLLTALQEHQLVHSPVFERGTNPVSWLKKNLDVGVGRDDDVITVALDSPLGPEACDIVNAIVFRYQEYHSQQKQSTARSILGTLMASRDALHGEWEGARETLAEFCRAHPGVGPERSAQTVVREKWRQLSVLLAEAEDETRRAEIAWRTGKGLASDAVLLRQLLPTLRGNNAWASPWPESTALTAQIQELERERIDRLAQLTPNHPRVRALDDAIAELRQQADAQQKQFAAACVDTLHQLWLTAKETRDQLQTDLAAQEKRVTDLDDMDAEYRSLLATVTNAESMLASIDKRIAEVDLSEEDTTSNVYILETASADTAEDVSRASLRLAVTVLLGLFVGLGCAWLRGMLDQRLRSIDEVTASLDLPVLAVLPRAPAADGEAELSAPERWDALSHAAEAARSLRTAVYFGTPEGEGDVVQITSPNMGDGKTTIAANLAIAMAKAGQRTLLIDADLRRPRQAELFQVANDAGLSNILSTDTTFDQVVQQTSVDALDLLPSGPIPPDPAEMLNSAKFERLLRELAERYDRVIVDSPPVLPVADARIIATKCDTTILALRVDRSTRKQALAARNGLAGVGARILGVTLNDMPQGIGYGYGAGYGYGYGYPHDAPDERRPNGSDHGPRAHSPRATAEGLRQRNGS